jgi:hypothetical protein
MGNLRKRVPGVTSRIDNTPLHLMGGEEVPSANL